MFEKKKNKALRQYNNFLQLHTRLLKWTLNIMEKETTVGLISRSPIICRGAE
jgi:hypothetical protein